MIIKFEDYLNESKKNKEPIDFEKNYSNYRKRLEEVIDGILPKEDRYVKVYIEYSSVVRVIDAEIIVYPILNDKKDGYNVHFSFDIYAPGRKQLISFSMINSKNPVWVESNIYKYYLETKDIDKIVKLIKSLSNYTDLTNKSLDHLIDSIYKDLSKNK